MRRAAPLALAALLGLAGPAVAGSAGAEPFRLVAMGTSLTASGGWTEPLRARLAACLGRPVQVTVVARDGALSEWGLAHVERAVAARPDAVTIEYATNDAVLTKLVTPWRSRDRVRAILARLREAVPGLRPLVLAMNPVAGPEGWKRPLLRAYERLHEEAAREAGAVFLDLGPAWRRLGPAALRAAIPDGLHPRPEAAAAIVAPAVAARLAEGPCGSIAVPPDVPPG